MFIATIWSLRFKYVGFVLRLGAIYDMHIEREQIAHAFGDFGLSMATCTSDEEDEREPII